MQIGTMAATVLLLTAVASQASGQEQEKEKERAASHCNRTPTHRLPEGIR